MRCKCSLCIPVYRSSSDLIPRNKTYNQWQMRSCPHMADTTLISCHISTHRQCAPIHLINLSGNWFPVLTATKTAPPHVALLFVKLHRVTCNTDPYCTIKHSHSPMECVAQWKHAFENYHHIHYSQSLWTRIIEHPHLMYVDLLSMVNSFLFGSPTENRFEVGDTSIQARRRPAVEMCICRNVGDLGTSKALSEWAVPFFNKDKICWFLGHLHKAETTLLGDIWLHATRGDLENRMQEDPSSYAILCCNKYVVWWHTD